MNNDLNRARVNFEVTVLGEKSSARVKQITTGFEYVLSAEELGPSIIEVLEPGLILSGFDTGGGANPNYLQVERLSPARLEKQRLANIESSLLQAAKAAGDNLASAARQLVESKDRLDSLVREATELQKRIIVASEEIRAAECLLRTRLSERDEAVQQLA